MRRMGKVVRLRTRYLHNCRSGRASWDATVELGWKYLHWKSYCFRRKHEIAERIFFHLMSCNVANVFVDAIGYGIYCFIESVTESEVVGIWSQPKSRSSFKLR